MRKRLSAIQVQKMAQPGLYSDGDNLYLQISKSGSKSWIFRYKIFGRVRDMGLGSTQLRSLLEARNEAHGYRKLILEGKDPLEERSRLKIAAQAKQSMSINFEACAVGCMDVRLKGLSKKHAGQWANTLRDYVFPVFGHVAIQDVDTNLVLAALSPIWDTRTETAKRVRNRIEIVIDWATARGSRSGTNPARWKGHLDQLLAAPSEIQKVKHHKALGFTRVGELVEKLKSHDRASARALEFLILTASRTNEVLGMKWSEVNFAEAMWSVPSHRMKTRRDHRVPLSIRAVEILEFQQTLDTNSDYVFPGRSAGRCMSNMTLSMQVRRLGYDCTVHGFRSSFSDWASEYTNYSRDEVEIALSHVVGSQVERAYRRGDLFLKRIQLMADWSVYCTEPSRDVCVTLKLRRA